MAVETSKPHTGVNATPLPVPWAVQTPDRIPKQRYYDPEFYALEKEMFWPRVWQMACRLEEIPSPAISSNTRFSTSPSSWCGWTARPCAPTTTPAGIGA